MIARRIAAVALASLLLAVFSLYREVRAEDPVVAGWIERISLTDRALLFDAKLDTGADSSSLNARDIERFRRGGRPFVRFMLTDDSGTTVRLEAPVIRIVRIKRAGAESDRRVVVRLNVCVGGFVTESDFTIADRRNLDVQVLIGRGLLAGRLIVDPGRERIVSDRCDLRR